MDPVLTHLQPRLSAEPCQLLAALVAALNNATNVQALEQFPAWRNVQPQAPESCHPIPFDSGMTDQRALSPQAVRFRLNAVILRVSCLGLQFVKADHHAPVFILVQHGLFRFTYQRQETLRAVRCHHSCFQLF